MGFLSPKNTFSTNAINAKPTLTVDSNAKNDKYTKTEVDTTHSNLIDGSVAELSTLKQLATALNDDRNFATTLTNSIATTQPLLENKNGRAGSIILNAYDNSL